VGDSLARLSQQRDRYSDVTASVEVETNHILIQPRDPRRTVPSVPYPTGVVPAGGIGHLLQRAFHICPRIPRPIDHHGVGEGIPVWANGTRVVRRAGGTPAFGTRVARGCDGDAAGVAGDIGGTATTKNTLYLVSCAAIPASSSRTPSRILADAKLVS